MPVIEQTQFTLPEANAWLASGKPAETKREKAMSHWLTDTSQAEAVSAVGGLSNVQRVRVLADPAKPEERRFEYVPRVPLEVLAQRREQERRAAVEARKAAILAKVEELKGDPKALREFLVNEAYAVLERAVIAALLSGLQTKPTKKPRQASGFWSKPGRSKRLDAERAKAAPVKQDDYAKALEQDRRNRIEASKKKAAGARKGA